jgi:LPS-assembly protein
MAGAQEPAAPPGAPFLRRLAAAGNAQEIIRILADRQEKFGEIYHLRGNVEITYGDMRLTADEVDYDQAAGTADARGNVHFIRESSQEDIQAQDAHYDLQTELGQFYHVHGSIGAGPVRQRPAVLTTTNPYYFEAERVDKVSEGTYVVYHGFVTSCRPWMPIWTFGTPRAVVRPGDRAYIYNSLVKLGNRVPVFYSPFFYHSLRKLPRSSGFLTPHIGNSSRKGKVVGEAFFWAINRSADAQVGAELYSQRGWAQSGTLRLRPRQGTALSADYFGVVDRGLKLGPAQLLQQGGRTVVVNGVSELPHGFRIVANFNYLSSFTFRLAFTDTFLEAVNSEVHSIVFGSNNFQAYSLNVSLSRFETFQSFPGRASGEPIDIRHAPSVEFNAVEHPVFGLKKDGRQLPLYFSFGTSGEAISRSEPPLFNAPPDTARIVTGFVPRLDFFPQVSLPLHLRGVHLLATYGIRSTVYGSRFQNGRVVDDALQRTSRHLAVEMRFPSFERVFHSPWKLFGEKVKHVVEPVAEFREIDGVKDFSEVLHFDERDLVANTRQWEYGVTNRLFSKRSDGVVREALSWELRQQYYFDPAFGGALVPGQRNVFTSTLALGGYAFLDAQRRFSPIVSSIRLLPAGNFNAEVRNDYDLNRHRFVNSGVTFNARRGNTWVSMSDYYVRSSPLLQASSNQVRAQFGYGSGNRRGFNAATTFVYDLKQGLLPYTGAQATYNFDCCGISVQFNRFHFGPTLRDERQFRVAVSFANIGTFGNLKKQERMF